MSTPHSSRHHAHDDRLQSREQNTSATTTSATTTTSASHPLGSTPSGHARRHAAEANTSRGSSAPTDTNAEDIPYRGYNNNQEIETLLHAYTQDQIHEAADILARTGHPSHTPADLLDVLQQAGVQPSAGTSNASASTGLAGAGARAVDGEDVPVDVGDLAGERIGATGGVVGESAQPRRQPDTRQPSQRPPWDRSIRLGDAGTAPDTTPRDTVASHYRGNGDRLPHSLAAYATTAALRAPGNSPASLLQPSVRLERYIRHYERALRDSHRRHPDLVVPTASATRSNLNGSREAMYPDPTAPSSRQPFVVRRAQALAAADGSAGTVLQMPLQSTHGPGQHRDPNVNTSSGPSPHSHRVRAPVEVYSAAFQRRMANVMYDKTGDQRYRFNLLAPDTSRSHTAASRAPACASSPGTREGVPSSIAEASCYSTASARLRRLEEQPQVFPRAYNPCTADRQTGQVLSPYAVRYLDADGSTLPRKDDPVSRGQQMRTLWSRDKFLAKQAKRSKTPLW